MKRFLLLLSLVITSVAIADNYKTYKPKDAMKIYHKGWIDFNKNGQKDIYEDPEQNIEDRITDLISQMTLDEKSCQMVTLYGYGRVLTDDLPTEEWKSQLWKDGMGAIDEHLNGFQQWGLPPSDNEYVWPASKHAWAINEVQRFFVEQTRLGIPVDFTNEGIRGIESFKATNFPTQLGLGHTWNRDLIQQVGYITGREARLLGYTNVYAPIVDVGRDQRWGRYEEVYGESPYLVAELSIPMVKGLQKDYQVAATAKHYIAYSNNKGAREGLSRVDPQMSRRELEYVHALPWTRVIQEAGILGAMSSYNDYDGEPIQSSSYWLNDRLRGQMGFIGYVVSDSDAVEYLHMKHNTAENMTESVYQSVMAGLNVRCTFRSPDSYVLPLRSLVEQGRIPMSVIDERVRDVLRVKFMVGLFDAPYQEDLAQADLEVNSAENQAVALQASLESLVLLKNDNLLPLDLSSYKKIAVIGPNADEESYALTHYGPLAVEVSTVLEGIEEYVGANAQVSYKKGCDLVDENWPKSEIVDFPLTASEISMIDEAVEELSKSDIGVVVLGGGTRTCGENKSRSDITLPGRQLDLIKALEKTGKPIVVVLINGRPLAINWIDENIPAILEAWYPGSQGGKAVAQTLFGDYNPGGKLTVTFPKTVGQIPFNFPTKPNAQVAGGRKAGLDGNQSRVNSALYSFGYGLSYTEFEYNNLEISKSTITEHQTVDVSFDVTNIGERDGDEVVQLYLNDAVSSTTTYEKNLRGFDRIHLKAGETKRVTFTLGWQDMALLDSRYEWVVEPGVFNVMVGKSSEDIVLKGEYRVIDPMQQNPAQASDSRISDNRMSESAKYAADGDTATAWSGAGGSSLTLSIPKDQQTKALEVMWSNKSGDEVSFEIQLSSGGGQFITCYKGTFAGKGITLRSYDFKADQASDVRLVILSGECSIAEIKNK
ncbi:MAG: glycoside hydrolase family 3 N-terminal domain-containing protein [Rikenellaceae bacterium]